MGYKHAYETICTHFQGIYNTIYGFGRPFWLLHFFTHPPIFLPVHIRFTRPNDRSLHKALQLTDNLDGVGEVDGARLVGDPTGVAAAVSGLQV